MVFIYLFRCLVGYNIGHVQKDIVFGNDFDGRLSIDMLKSCSCLI